MGPFVSRQQQALLADPKEKKENVYPRILYNVLTEW